MNNNFIKNPGMNHAITNFILGTHISPPVGAGVNTLIGHGFDAEALTNSYMQNILDAINETARATAITDNYKLRSIPLFNRRISTVSMVHDQSDSFRRGFVSYIKDALYHNTINIVYTLGFEHNRSVTSVRVDMDDNESLIREYYLAENENQYRNKVTLEIVEGQSNGDLSEWLWNKVLYFKKFDIFIIALRSINSVMNTDAQKNHSLEIRFVYRNLSEVQAFDEEFQNFSLKSFAPSIRTYKSDRSYLRSIKIINPDDLYTTDSMRDILDQFNEFLDKDNALYRKFGISSKRGILLTGPPGTGKTTLIKLLLNDVAEKQLNDIKYRANIEVRSISIDESTTSETLVRAFEIDDDASTPDKRILMIIEDMDSIDDRLKSSFLNLLDGISTDEISSSVFVVATTNYPERIDQALVNRAGRFDRMYNFGDPTAEAREWFFRKRNMLELMDEEALINSLVPLTDGLSMANLNEVLISLVRQYDINGEIDIHTVIKNIKNSIKAQQKGFPKENPNGIGFSN